MRLITVLLISVIYPFVGMAASASIEEFMTMHAEKQQQVLKDVGYIEGGEVGDWDALQAYADALHLKYEETDLVLLPKEELGLLKELVRADSTIEYFTQDKAIMFRGCRMGAALSVYLPLPDAKDATAGCYAKLKGLTSEEVQEVKNLSIKSDEAIIQRANESNDLRKNYYLADSGRYLCSANIDCAEGSKRIYEALLDEYVTKGVEKYDPNMLGDTVLILQGHLGQTNNVFLLTATYELQYKLFKAGVIQQDKSGLANLADAYRAEMKPGDKHLEEVLAILDSGRSILEMEAERYRREHGLPKFVEDSYAQPDVSVAVQNDVYAASPAKAAVTQQAEPTGQPPEVTTEVIEDKQPEKGQWLWLVAGIGLLGLFGFIMNRRKKS